MHAKRSIVYYYYYIIQQYACVINITWARWVAEGADFSRWGLQGRQT